MGGNLSTRVLLTAILLCLVLLAAQRLRPIEVAPGSGTDETNRSHFNFMQIVTKSGPVLVRTDTTTGQLWRSLDLLEEGGRWVAFPEPPKAKWSAFDVPPGEQWVEWVGPHSAPVEPSGFEGDLDFFAGVLSEDSPPEMQSWAAEQLAVSPRDDAAVVPLLLEALEHGKPEALPALIEALERRADSSALPALRGLLEHSDAQVREKARHAIDALE